MSSLPDSLPAPLRGVPPPNSPGVPDLPAARALDHAFLWRHGVVVPLLLAAAATAFAHSGADLRVSGWFYDGAAAHFVASGSGWIELIGHRLAKSLLLGGWLMLGAAALAAAWLPPLRPHRRLLWTTWAAMGLGPTLVTLLKDINSHVCPWDLAQFGGAAQYSAHWFVPRIEAGRCFPGGHASAGCALIALGFAGRALRRPALQHAGVALAVIVGGLFGAVRLTQGAHFMSHNLWAAAIDWWCAALLFLPLLWHRRSSR